jgi:hypothetical protein
MRREAVPILGWAALLTVLVVALWVWTPFELPPAIYSGAVALVWLVGIFVWARPPGDRPAQPVRDLSFASVLVAVAVAMLALGALVGLWLVLIGAGVLAAGVAGLALGR